MSKGISMTRDELAALKGHFGRDGTVMENYREQFIELYNKNNHPPRG